MNRPLYLQPPSAQTHQPHAQPTLSGTVERDGNRLVIRCPYTPSALGFFHALPNSRFARVAKQWTCQSTPLAASMLRDTGLTLDDAADRLADQWQAAMAEPVKGSVDTSMLKVKPWSHQRAIAEFCADKYGAMVASGMGCVDAHTEFLTPRGWKRIDQYADGDLVAQYDIESNSMEFVSPEKYHVYECNEPIYHFKHSRGLDQVLTPNHNVLLFAEKNKSGEIKAKTVTASDLANKSAGCSHGRFLTAATYEGGSGISLSDEQLRIQVALMADGHFPNGSNTVRINLKKRRKKIRMQQLLDAAGLEHRRRDREDGYSEFFFKAPIKCKAYCGDWWACSLHQRKVICDEVRHWDGSIDARPNGGVQFFTTIKDSADFIQWCFISTGRRASIVVDNRIDKPTCWTVRAIGSGSTGNFCHYARQNGNLSLVKPEGNKVYCFTVPSSYLVLRRNGNIFITGNSGKSLTSILLLTHWRCRTVIVLCPKAVLGVWRREMAKYCGLSHQVAVLDEGTSAAKDKQVALAMRKADSVGVTMVVVNYETFWREPLFKRLKSIEWDLVIADESHRCFSGETLISTPDGQVPISELNPGDTVYGYDHSSNSIVVTEVAATMSSLGETISVGGNECTPDHPYFTVEHGYIDASECGEMTGLFIDEQCQKANHCVLPKLQKGFQCRSCGQEVLLKVMRQSFQEGQVVQGKKKKAPSSILEKLQELRRPVCRAIREAASRILQQIMQIDHAVFSSGSEKKVGRCHEADDSKSSRSGEAKKAPAWKIKSILRSSSKREVNHREQGEKRIQEFKRRKRKAINSAAIGIIQGSWMGMRSYCLDSWSRATVSFALQNRHCERIVDDRHRSRRQIASSKGGNQKGQEEAKVPRVERLDDTKILEQGDRQRSPFLRAKSRVYNIETATGNYFAGGWLVHNCKSPTSRQGKAAADLAQHCQRRLLLTGTPMPSGPLDMFGQYKIIEPALFGTNYSRFRTRYAITHDQYKNKVLQLINQDEFIAKYRQLAFRVETKDVIDLPPITHTTIQVRLAPKTMQSYRTLQKQCLLELESGEVTAGNAGVKLIRLAQMASGHVNNDDGRTVRVGDEKKQALIDLLSDIDACEPMVVFCRFREDLKQIEEAAIQLGRKYGEISGSRKDLTPHATMPDWVGVMGVQEQAGGVGIDLTRARYVTDFSRGYSLGDYDQKMARVHRPGQERPTFVYSLVAEGTVDNAVMSALRTKSDVVGEVLKHIKWRDDG